MRGCEFYEKDRISVLRPLGHVQGSLVRTAQDALLQTIELAVAAEEVGVDGAYFRVHHFARQLASPFPLLAAMAARTSIEIGTGVIDMRYENPLYMAEEAAAADLISGGRLQLGVSRGSPETALDGSAAFGLRPGRGRDRRRHGPPAHELFRRDRRRGRRRGQSADRRARRAGPDSAAVTGAARPIWWGAGTRATAVGRPSRA